MYGSDDSDNKWTFTRCKSWDAIDGVCRSQLSEPGQRDLPADDIRAIPVLRRLLGDQADPLARHFIFEYLEARLYRSRSTFTSALDEYDQVCRQHDTEMNGIRQACISKWGDVPALTTYRQMAIREQKAKNFQRDLWWAERGIALYGTRLVTQIRSMTSGIELARTGPRSRAQ